MYVHQLHVINEYIGQLALPHAAATCPLYSSINRGTYAYTFLN
jgi:hypothetical protein